MDIGKRIRQLRIKNDLTLEELASRCELTKGFLSQLERNLTSPSIQTLEDITEALGTSMSDFFKKEKNEKVVFNEEDVFVDEQEDITIHWIVPNAQKNDMEPIILEIKPQKESKLILSHEGEEFGYVLSGEIMLCIENDKGLKVKQGETFYMDGTREHYLKNVSNDIVKVLWICTPPIF
ncbi:MAG TPA: Cro/Cl family transcriptional regulator [Erysipelotrichaceae bacterium]|nr:cupin domain-containing protein [Erysipelotrichaceae bacterium]HCY05841.1 Cro/Cl family transcriptional regulator [Erysipelotrichaceae bacterium]